MGPRLLFYWVSFTLLFHAGLNWVVDAWPRLYLHTDLLSLVSLLIVPVAQGLALRLAGESWAREWFVATLGALLLSTAVVNAVRWPLGSVAPSLASVGFGMFLPAILIAVFQWLVLRYHVRRPELWWAVAAAAVLTSFAIRWSVGRSITSAALPSAVWRTAIPVAMGLVQGVGLAWLLSERQNTAGALRDRPHWFVIEWTTGAGVAMLVIMSVISLMSGGIGGRNLQLEMYVLPMVAGLVIGTVQWWILRTRVPIGPAWIAATIGALAVPVVSSVVPPLTQWFGYVWFLSLYTPGLFGALGAWVGAAQWLVLRRHLPGAWRWVPVSALGWSAWHLRFVPGFDFMTVGIVAGVVTGVAMAWTIGTRELRNVRPDES